MSFIQYRNCIFNRAKSLFSVNPIQIAVLMSVVKLTIKYIFT